MTFPDFHLLQPSLEISHFALCRGSSGVISRSASSCLWQTAPFLSGRDFKNLPSRCRILFRCETMVPLYGAGSPAAQIEQRTRTYHIHKDPTESTQWIVWTSKRANTSLRWSFYTSGSAKLQAPALSSSVMHDLFNHYRIYLSWDSLWALNVNWCLLVFTAADLEFVYAHCEAAA